jgi:hypothetical protein
MQHLSNFLFIWQLSLFIIILGNIAKLFTDYLLTKIK